MEGKLAELQGQMNSADFYQQDKATIQTVVTDLKEIEAVLADAYRRWEELESLS